LHKPGELTSIRAAALVRELAGCGTALAGRNDQETAAASASLLRDVVLAVRDLAGRPWLDASADDPDVAAFTAMLATASPPGPDAIDETCSRVLWARFTPAGAFRGDSS